MKTARYSSDRPWELSSREKQASSNGLVFVARPVGDGRWAVAHVEVASQLPVGGKVALVDSEIEARNLASRLAEQLSSKSQGRVANAKVEPGQRVSSNGRTGSVIRLYHGLRMASVKWDDETKPSLVAQELLASRKGGAS